MSESSDDVPLAQLVKKNDDEVKQEPKTQPQEPKAEQAAQNGAAPPAAAAAKQEDDGSSSDEDAPLIVRKAAAKNGEFGAALSSSRRTMAFRVSERSGQCGNLYKPGGPLVFRHCCCRHGSGRPPVLCSSLLPCALQSPSQTSNRQARMLARRRQ